MIEEEENEVVVVEELEEEEEQSFADGDPFHQQEEPNRKRKQRDLTKLQKEEIKNVIEQRLSRKCSI